MISCQQCQNRIDALDAAGKHASDVYAVGNQKRSEMGHSMFFASDGRTALCIAKRLEETR